MPLFDATIPRDVDSLVRVDLAISKSKGQWLGTNIVGDYYVVRVEVPAESTELFKRICQPIELINANSKS